MKFKDLLEEHDYYCSENNYYSNDASKEWGNFQAFYDEYKNADIDMNLIFRWDIKEKDNGMFYMQVFIMHQRKGIYAPHYIDNVVEDDFENIKSLLQPHLDKIIKNWIPFTIS